MSLPLRSTRALARSVTPTPTLSRRGLVRGALGLALGASGCGYLKANFARTNALTQELDAYVFQKPFEEVWAKVPTVKHFDGGALLSWSDTSPTTARTSPRVEKAKGAGNDQILRTTFLEAEGARAPRGCQVRYFENETEVTSRDGKEVGTQNSRNRRLDIELDLVRLFDPQGAARIEASGEEAARSGEWYPKKKT
jgi:hypothetical protein